MANFNIGIDCPTENDAERLMEHIKSLDFYQEELERYDERVSLVTKQGILDSLKEFAKFKNIELSIEVWPEDIDYDEAEESGSLESIDY